MAFSGVRSSWLIFARNRLLATLALSAFSRLARKSSSILCRSETSRVTASASFRGAVQDAVRRRLATHLEPAVQLPVGGGKPELGPDLRTARNAIGDRAGDRHAILHMNGVEKAVVHDGVRRAIKYAHRIGSRPNHLARCAMQGVEVGSDLRQIEAAVPFVRRAGLLELSFGFVPDAACCSAALSYRGAGLRGAVLSMTVARQL